jgi:hypothetical protein
MSAYLMEGITTNTTGKETLIRVVGTREPPAKMSLQVAVTGAANVQIQGKIAKEAPWADVCPAFNASGIAYIEPIQYLRAVTSGMATSSSVSVWAAWGWF